MDELLVDVGELCVHNFAHHVMESILENGEVPFWEKHCGGSEGLEDTLVARSSLFPYKLKPSK